MSKIKVAVFGRGAIAQRRHIPEYANNANVELVAFVDPVKERAEEMAAQYGGKAYTDYQELLKNEKLDAVSVCTPNYLHAPMSIAGANAGLHVLVEKPMATTAEEGEQMIEAARKNGCT